jgi:hypothetical protein
LDPWWTFCLTCVDQRNELHRTFDIVDCEVDRLVNGVLPSVDEPVDEDHRVDLQSVVCVVACAAPLQNVASPSSSGWCMSLHRFPVPAHV